MAVSTAISRCSLVVRAIDVWTGKLVSDAALQVRLQDSRSKPLRTSEGSWAFLDIRDARCTVTIESPSYQSCSQDVDLTELSPLWPVVTICLLPGRRYVPPAAATGLLCRVVDGDGGPLVGVKAIAYVDDDNAARARILDEKAEAGSRELQFVPGSSSLMDGDALAIRNKERTAFEWFRVYVGGGREDMRLRLDRPLAGSWKRHTALVPAAAAVSDADGWLVIPFRGQMPAISAIQARLDYMGQTAEVSWQAQGGLITSLPDYVWPVRA